MEEAGNGGVETAVVPPIVSGAVFFRRRHFVTGFFRPNPGRHRRRAGPLPDGFPEGGGGRANPADGAVGGGALFPLSAGGIFAELRLHRRAAASTDNGGLWVFPVLFRLLLYSCLRLRRCAAGFGGVWSSVRSDAALLFSAGRSSMGTFGDFGLSVSWRRTADGTCAVRPGVVDPLCGDFRSASGGDVRGLDAGSLVFAAAFRADPVWIRNTVFDW